MQDYSFFWQRSKIPLKCPKQLKKLRSIYDSLDRQDIFFSQKTHFFLFCEVKYRKDFVILHRSYPRLRANGWDGDILESVIDALFLAIWNFHNTDKPVKSNSGDECYGCSIYSRSVPRANYALTHTFRGALYTDRRGYSDSVRSLVGLWKASDSGTGRWGYPAFCMLSLIAKNPLANGYQSEQLLLTDARS